MTENNDLNIRWLYLTAGTITFLFAGIIYAWSILNVKFAEDFGWTNNDLSTNYTITISMFCIGCIAGGALMRKLSVKIPLIVGGIMVFAGFYLTSQLDGSSVTMLFLAYGVLAGLGIGMGYNTILAAVGAWFPDKKGLASGIMMMGFGASTLVFGNIAGSLMNDPGFGWRKVFFLLAVCTGALMLLMGIIIKMPGKDMVLPKPSGGNSSNNFKEDFEAKDYPPGEMLKRVSFWKFFVAMLLLGAAGSSVLSFARNFAMSVGAAAGAAGLFVGLLSIANGLGRIVAGVVYDKAGRKAVMLYVSLINIAANTLCLLTALTMSVPLCLIAFIVVGLAYGGNTNATSVFMTAFYGIKYYPQNLSWGLLTLLPASFLARLSTTLLNSSGGYVVPFAVLVVYAVISTGLHMSNKRP